MKKWNYKKDPFASREASKYTNPVPSRELIIDFLTKKGCSQSRSQLVSAFGLSDTFDREAFRRRLKAMVRDGQLVRRRGQYDLSTRGDLVQGCVIGHRDGYGFVAPEDCTSQVFLSAREMRKVLHGDLVEVRIVNVDSHNRREGKIQKVLERKVKEIVGRFFIEAGVGFVDPDNKHINQDIVVPIVDSLNAKPGQLVNAKIIAPPTEHTQPIGHIIEILGDYKAPGLEIEVAIRAHNLPHFWTSDVLQEVSQFSKEVRDADKKDRVDLRDLPLVTIDGEDAKDFDDAVYCEKKGANNGWRLVVAIADVSHYVKLGSALDREAIERGNSVYFPGKVIPMLPRELSNGLCSLNPKVDRLCLVCDASITPDGNVSRYRFYEAVMRSHARLTYANVAKLLTTKNKVLEKQYAEILPHVKDLYALFEVLNAARSKRGALHFETPDYRVEFGEGRKIKRLYSVVRNVAHQIIEECMLCANICAAKFLDKHHAPGLFRVHDGPKAEKWADLKVFLGELGLLIGGGDLPTSIDYAKLIDQVSDRPDAHLIHMVLLRSLSQAFYSPDNDGHFALAFETYTHFTSPIRRYPDLMVHRAIRAVLSKQGLEKLPNYEDRLALGEQCSITERRADDATRYALNWLKCEYMQDKIGEEYEGIISGVTGFGMFVELRELYIEGLVSIASLDDDYYHFDPVHHRLNGERTGKSYRIGDLLKVRVDRVNLENREIDFALVKRAKALKNTRKKKNKITRS